MVATIRIDGATAVLSGTSGPPAAHLSQCLQFLHPARFFNKAFQQKRWDGYVKFFDGARFGAGFTSRVKKHLEQQGLEVRVTAKGGGAVEADDFDASYLHGITMWDHQVAAVLTMFRHGRGVLREPTGSGKTAMMAAAARYVWERKGWRSLVIVPKKGLAVQTRMAFEQFYNGEVSVGIAGDGQREEGPITIATAQTLINYKDHHVKMKGKPRRKIKGDPWLRELIESTDVLFLDECHRASSTTWQDIADVCPAKRRYGLSGTPITDDVLEDVKLEQQCGPIIHETEAVDLIEDGLTAEPKIVMVMSDNASGPVLPKTFDRHARAISLDYRSAYKAGIAENDHHNRTIIAAARWMMARKRKVLILCRLKAHFVRLAELLSDYRVDFAALWGATKTAEREAAKTAFREGEINCILATTIFDEGEDLGGVGGVVLGEGVKAITTNLQRIGRGMRNDTEDVWVVDIVPTCHKTLQEHAAQRAEDYEEAGYTVAILEEWPRGRLRDLPNNLLPFETWDALLASG